MASRAYLNQYWSLLKGVTLVRCRVSVGAAGAVTLQKYVWPAGAPNSGSLGTYAAASTSGGGTSWPSQYQQGTEGVRSVTRTGAGLWTLVLQDNFQRLLDLSMYTSLAGGLATCLAVAENTTITSLGTAGGSTIGVALLSATATALDPASGDIVTLNMVLQNASEP